MSVSLPCTSPRLKPHSPDDGVCRRNGLGQAPGGPGFDPEPCMTCDSTGRVTYAERPRRTERVTYLACVAQELVDVGQPPLNVFVGQVLMDWPELTGDISVWSIDDSICPEPRLVVLIRPGPTGRPQATYL